MVEREKKYAYVIPIKDLRHLKSRRRRKLKKLVEAIDRGRVSKGESKLSDNKYIVCNQDESYADEVWEVILKGEKQKEIKAKPIDPDAETAHARYMDELKEDENNED